MVGETEVVVRANHDDSPSIDHHFRILRRFKLTEEKVVTALSQTLGYFENL
jgi:hypothetical protein